MLYIMGVNQPRLTIGSQPLISQGEGNPMIDNARHVPGSTRSCGSAFSRSAAPFRRFQTVPKKSVQNPYRSDHFRECEFSIASASTTCNFTALKCTDFPCSGAFPLPRGEGQGEGQTSILFASRRSTLASRHLPRVTASLRHRVSNSRLRRGKSITNTVQNGTKRDDLQILRKPTTSYQPLTTTPRSVVPFCNQTFDPCSRRGHESLEKTYYDAF
jgi:hypothetical protein